MRKAGDMRSPRYDGLFVRCTPNAAEVSDHYLLPQRNQSGAMSDTSIDTGEAEEHACMGSVKIE